MNQPAPPYRGRFAPSPTGPLHFGSLVTALASYLDAKANNGKWLVRIEDIDPPRARPGADKQILEALATHGLTWDDDLLYQSTRYPAYRRAIEVFFDTGFAYYCDCSRQQLQGSPVYPGTCRERSDTIPGECAVRIRVQDAKIRFQDQIQGPQSVNLAQEVGDFVIYRKDGLYAYQLATALDDAFQQINKVVRGYDLLDSTCRQLYLLQLLRCQPPDYCHIPVIVNQQGQKLSKQNLAQPLIAKHNRRNLYNALIALGQQPDTALIDASVEDILIWSVKHWNIQNVPRTVEIPYDAILQKR